MENYLFNAYNVIMVFLTVTVFYKLLWVYFASSKILFWLAPVILYTMLWNYILLNGSFQYYDFTTIFLTTAGLYFIARQNFGMFLFVFIIGLVNKRNDRLPDIFIRAIQLPRILYKKNTCKNRSDLGTFHRL